MVGAFPLSAAVGALPELLPEPAAVGWEPGCWEAAVVAAAVVSPEDSAEEEAELSAAVVVPSAMVPVLFLKITGVCPL